MNQEPKPSLPLPLLDTLKEYHPKVQAIYMSLLDTLQSDLAQTHTTTVAGVNEQVTSCDAVDESGNRYEIKQHIIDPSDTTPRVGVFTVKSYNSRVPIEKLEDAYSVDFQLCNGFMFAVHNTLVGQRANKVTQTIDSQEDIDKIAAQLQNLKTVPANVYNTSQP